MICLKCGHEWFIEETPWPKDIDCPNCGKHWFKDGKYVGGHKCRICGRTLTASESVKRGIGPVCWAKVYTGLEKEFYANERYWKFYSDGANIVYRSSTDMRNWSSPETVSVAPEDLSKVLEWKDGKWHVKETWREGEG